METIDIQKLVDELSDLKKRAKLTKIQLRQAEREKFGNEYVEEIKAKHPDGLLKLQVYYPDWHDEGYWHFNVECFYKGRQVGQSGQAEDSFLEALDAGRICAQELAANFDPEKRQSADDLNWWSR